MARVQDTKHRIVFNWSAVVLAAGSSYLRRRHSDSLPTFGLKLAAEKSSTFELSSDEAKQCGIAQLCPGPIIPNLDMNRNKRTNRACSPSSITTKADCSDATANTAAYAKPSSKKSLNRKAVTAGKSLHRDGTMSAVKGQLSAHSSEALGSVEADKPADIVRSGKIQVGCARNAGVAAPAAAAMRFVTAATAKQV